MATIITSSIRVTAGDYATITLWEADLADLVSKDEQHFGQLYDEVYDELVIFTGTTSDATRFATLQPAPGEQFDFRIAGSGPRLRVTVSPQGHFLDVLDPFFVFENFEIERVSGDSIQSSSAAINVAAANTTVRGMMIHKPPKGSARGIGIIANVGPYFIHNNFLYDIDQGTSRGMSLSVGTGVTCEVYNNTIIDAVTNGFKLETNHASAILNVKNNIALNAGTDFTYNVVNGTINTDKNLSSDATADDNGDGTHFNSETPSDILVNITAGSEDLHLKTGTNAIDGGVDLETTPPNIEFDIDGYDRDAGAVSWDIGADQQGLDVTDNGSGDINLNPIGSTLVTIASGTPAITLEGALNVSPGGSTLSAVGSNDSAVIKVDTELNVTGSTLSTIDSEDPTIQVGVDLAIELNVGGSTLETVASGNPIIEIDGSITLNPIGDSLSAIDSFDPNLQILDNFEDIVLDPAGSGLSTIVSEDPTFDISGDIIVSPSGSSLDNVTSHQPTITGATSPVGGNNRPKYFARLRREKSGV